MIRISHETPIGLFKESLRFNDYEYCLVHLLSEQPEYLKHFEWCRDNKHPFLLDNSIFELGEAFKAGEFAKWVERLQPDEYIIPDSLENYRKTISNIVDWNDVYGDLPGIKIGVVQGKTYGEIVRCYGVVNVECDKIAISFDYSYYEKIFPHSNKFFSWCMGRVLLLDKLLRDGVINTEKKHHLLGIGLPSEGEFYRDYEWIDSIDTSNPVVAAIKGVRYRDTWGLMNKESQKLCELISYPEDKIDRDTLYHNIKLFKKYFVEQ